MSSKHDLESGQYYDSWSKIWSVYVSETSMLDKVLVESWKGDMDGILIYSGLFSAIVTAFIIDGYKNLMPDPGTTTVTLLAQISQQLASSSNGSHADALSLPDSFQPTSSSLRVNAAWFCSLGFSLTCALAAILVQQWARNYLQAINYRNVPWKKGPVREFLYQGVMTFKMSAFVEGIPTLLHIAVLLFLVGLVDFLFGVNYVIAYIVLTIVIIDTILYVAITILAVADSKCPYSTPLSSVYWKLARIGHNDMHKFQRIEEHVDNDSTQYDERKLRALLTTGMLSGEGELQPFIEGLVELPSNPERKLMEDLLKETQFFDRIIALLVTCRNPSALTEDLRHKRASTYIKAIIFFLDITDRDFRVTWLSARSFPGDALARTLMELKKNPEVACIANSAAEAIIRYLRGDIAAVTKLGSQEQWTTKATTTLLEILHGLDSIVPIFEILTLPNSSQSAHYQSLISILHKAYIPKILSTQRPSQEDIKASLKATYVMTCYRQNSEWVSMDFDSIADALVTYRNTPAIAHYANCTVARLACQLQCEIVLGSYHNQAADSTIEEYRRRLDRLKIDVEGDLQQQLIAKGEDVGSQPSEPPLNLSMRHQKFELQLTLEFAHPNATEIAKAVLSRGYTVVLIALLGSMATSPPPPDEALELILHILQFITNNLVACFASPKAQEHLVRQAHTVITHFYSKLVGGHAIIDGSVHPVSSILAIIGKLFDVLETVQERDLLETNKTFKENILKKLKEATPLHSSVLGLHKAGGCSSGIQIDFAHNTVSNCDCPSRAF